MIKHSYKLMALLVLLVIPSLACLGSVQQAPDWELRGWTATPSMTPSVEPQFTPTPVVIFITATFEVHTIEVIVDALDVRSGPSEDNPSVGFVSKGDIVEVSGCVVDDNGEVWAHLVSPVDGWSAVTWGGKVFVKPLPRC